jgi:hypothetical protein
MATVREKLEVLRRHGCVVDEIVATEVLVEGHWLHREGINVLFCRPEDVPTAREFWPDARDGVLRGVTTLSDRPKQ